jgi:hypothetical protein
MLVGAAVGSTYGYYQYNDQQEDPLYGRGLETILWGVIGGGVGGMLGGAAGYLIPPRQAQSASVSFNPAPAGGVAVKLTVRR